MPDRIAAATYLCAAAAAGGDLFLANVCPRHFEAVTAALREIGCTLLPERCGIRIVRRCPLIGGLTVQTMPYPGFPTDAQALLMAACLKARGRSVFVENIFENRFRHVPEMRRLGAQIRIEGRAASVEGAERLSGARTSATDLRGGAALIIAGLSAEGVTEVADAGHIERGYEDLSGALQSVGANVTRIATPRESGDSRE